MMWECERGEIDILARYKFAIVLGSLYWNLKCFEEHVIILYLTVAWLYLGSGNILYLSVILFWQRQHLCVCVYVCMYTTTDTYYYYNRQNQLSQVVEMKMLRYVHFPLLLLKRIKCFSGIFFQDP